MKIPRDKYLQELQSVMHNGMIKIITGVRRCGKSYLLFELFKQSLLDNGVNEDHVIQVDWKTDVVKISGIRTHYWIILTGIL